MDQYLKDKLDQIKSDKIAKQVEKIISNSTMQYAKSEIYGRDYSRWVGGYCSYTNEIIKALEYLDYQFAPELTSEEQEKELEEFETKLKEAIDNPKSSLQLQFDLLSDKE